MTHLSHDELREIMQHLVRNEEDDHFHLDPAAPAHVKSNYEAMMMEDDTPPDLQDAPPPAPVAEPETPVCWLHPEHGLMEYRGRGWSHDFNAVIDMWDCGHCTYTLRRPVNPYRPGESLLPATFPPKESFEKPYQSLARTFTLSDMDMTVAGVPFPKTKTVKLGDE